MIYWQIYRQWLVKLIKQRIYLSKEGFKPELLETAKQLKNLIEFNSYRNNDTLAGLLLRKQELILRLIPKNKAYEKQVSTFEMAIRKASARDF